MSGLSYFDDGGEVDATEQEAPSSRVDVKPTTGKGPYAIGTPVGNVPMAPGVLDAMEQLYRQKLEQQNSFMEAMKDAAAWSSGGIQGPSQALALRAREKEAQAANLFQIQSQLAQFKAAQQAQKEFENRRTQQLAGAGGEGPAVGGAQMFGMPPEIRTALMNARTEADYNKIYNDWAKKKAEVEANPEFDVPKIPVVLQDANGEYYRDVISARQLRANPSKYMETEGTRAAIQSITQPKEKVTGELLPEEKQPPAAPAVKVPSAGVDQYKFENLSPAQLDMLSKAAKDEGLITDPVKRADAQAIFNKLPFEKRRHLFEVSLRPEGEVPVSPAAPTLPAQQAAPTPRKPTAGELERKAEVGKQVEIQAETERLKTDKIERDKFINESDPIRVSDRKVRAERVAKMVKEDPNLVGVLTQPNVKMAFANVLSQGLSTPSGSISVKGLSEAIYQSLPSTMSTAKRREIAGYIANMELDTSQLMNGQGQISDGEREIIRSASVSIEDPAEVVYKKARMMELRQNTLQKLRSIYGTGDKYTTNFERFKNEPEYKRIAAEYEKQLQNIVNEEVTFDRSKVNKKGAPAATVPGPYSDPDKERRYQEWKRSQNK